MHLKNKYIVCPSKSSPGLKEQSFQLEMMKKINVISEPFHTQELGLLFPKRYNRTFTFAMELVNKP